MSLNNFLKKHSIEDDAMEEFAEKLTTGRSLSELSRMVDLDPEKTYILAKFYSKEILGEDLEDISPDLTEQRESLAKHHIREVSHKIDSKKHHDILHDILEDMMMLKLEKNGKIPLS